MHFKLLDIMLMRLLCIDTCISEGHIPSRVGRCHHTHAMKARCDRWMQVSRPGVCHSWRSTSGHGQTAQAVFVVTECHHIAVFKAQHQVKWLELLVKLKKPIRSSDFQVDSHGQKEERTAKREVTGGQYSGDPGVEARPVTVGMPDLTGWMVDADESLPVRLERSGELVFF